MLGPIPAFRKKKRNQYIYLLLVKAKSSSILNHSPEIIFDIQLTRSLPPTVRIDLDIDPLEIL